MPGFLGWLVHIVFSVRDLPYLYFVGIFTIMHQSFVTTTPSSAGLLAGICWKNIRIFNGCEVLIENSVTRVTVRHHEACRVMPNRYPSDGTFNLHRRTIMDSFSCILFLQQLHSDLNMCCFINFTLK